MTTTISGTSGIQTPSLDLTTPLPVTEGGTGTSTVKPYRMVVGTPIATTSGTSHDFTSIPSWVKRITLLFNGISTNGSSYPLIQIGSGSITTSGYTASTSQIQGGGVAGTYSATTGFILFGAPSIYSAYGAVRLSHIGSNVWVEEGTVIQTVPNVNPSAGIVSLSGVLDRIRLTTVNGTDTFDAGSFNIIYEGYED